MSDLPVVPVRRLMSSRRPEYVTKEDDWKFIKYPQALAQWKARTLERADANLNTSGVQEIDNAQRRAPTPTTGTAAGNRLLPLSLAQNLAAATLRPSYELSRVSAMSTSDLQSPVATPTPGRDQNTRIGTVKGKEPAHVNEKPAKQNTKIGNLNQTQPQTRSHAPPEQLQTPISKSVKYDDHASHASHHPYYHGGTHESPAGPSQTPLEVSALAQQIAHALRMDAEKDGAVTTPADEILHMKFKPTSTNTPAVKSSGHAQPMTSSEQAPMLVSSSDEDDNMQVDDAQVETINYGPATTSQSRKSKLKPTWGDGSIERPFKYHRSIPGALLDSQGRRKDGSTVWFLSSGPFQVKEPIFQRYCTVKPGDIYFHEDSSSTSRFTRKAWLYTDDEEWIDITQECEKNTSFVDHPNLKYYDRVLEIRKNRQPNWVLRATKEAYVRKLRSQKVAGERASTSVLRSRSIIPGSSVSRAQSVPLD